MNLNFLKKAGIITASTIGAIYVTFLLAPFVISPIVNNYIPIVNNEIKKATGLNSRIEDFRIVTTPKLTFGAKLGKFAILTPQNKEIFEAENFAVKMSLLPLLAKRIEVDLVQVGSVDLKLGLNKDGSLELEKYLILNSDTTQKTEKVCETSEPINLPLGLRLSNHLPDIKIGKYDIEFIDLSTGNKYEIEGDKTEITDFILNKRVKVLASGKAKLAEREQFTYKVKINNKIMPDLYLHELVFNPEGANEREKQVSASQDFEINVLDIFKGIYNNKITANLDADLTLTKDGNSGYVKADNLSIVNLPPSMTNLVFKGHKINIDSNICWMIYVL